MAAPRTSPIDIRKSALRAALKVERPVIGPSALAMLVDRLFMEILGDGARKIACVWPLPGEVDLRALCLRLHQADREVLLPETTRPGNPLVFRRWCPTARMLAGRFGTSHPEGANESPELILVPLLAFDRTGARLGYGGGYYDRTLEQFEVPAIGYGMAAQECPEVPVGPHDVRLSRIVTEREVIHTQIKRKV